MMDKGESSNRPNDAGPGVPEDWLSARQTRDMVSVALYTQDPFRPIVSRVSAGLIRTRAQIFDFNGLRERDFEIPIKFWADYGDNYFICDWNIGDFSTLVGETPRAFAYGVCFHREGLREMVPHAFKEVAKVTLPTESKDPGGRRMSELWPDWVAE